MKSKIDKDGNLHIERAGKFKAQMCPHRSDSGEYNQCGDWCPKFHEMEGADDSGIAIMLLCAMGQLLVRNVKDERPRNE